MNESFKEDPEDYEDMDDSSSPTRGLASASPEVFRQAYDKFSKIDLNATSPILTRKKSTPSLLSPAKTDPDLSLPDIVVNETHGESGSSTVTASPETVQGVEQDTLESPSPSPQPLAKRSTHKARNESIDGGFGYVIVHGRSKAPRRSPSPSPSPADSRIQSPEIVTTMEDFPSSPISPPTSPESSLKVKKSQQSMRKLSPLKPPERPVSIGLTTPEIMDRFPAVPSSTTSSEHPAVAKGPATSTTKAPSPSPTNTTTATATSPAVITTTTTPAASQINSPAQIKSNTTTSPQPAKKANPKSAIPGWWDYNSDDEETGGWATVVVATKSRY